MAGDLRPTEALLAAEIPDLIEHLGLAVAKANKALLEADSEETRSKTVFAINQAEIELKVAISMSRKTEAGGGLGFALYGFSVNAAYSKTYGYEETASSSIKLTMSAIPRPTPPASK